MPTLWSRYYPARWRTSSHCSRTPQDCSVSLEEQLWPSSSRNDLSTRRASLSPSHSDEGHSPFWYQGQVSSALYWSILYSCKTRTRGISVGTAIKPFSGSRCFPCVTTPSLLQRTELNGRSWSAWTARGSLLSRALQLASLIKLNAVPVRWQPTSYKV